MLAHPLIVTHDKLINQVLNKLAEHMTVEWLIAASTVALVAIVITAIVLMMRHRERMRKAAREAESLNVLSDDTRRAFWYSSADHSGTSDSSSHDGGWSDSAGDSSGGHDGGGHDGGGGDGGSH